jgi:phosphoglycerol transferase MdoB-like AlkP superfamily enzyme
MAIVVVLAAGVSLPLALGRTKFTIRPPVVLAAIVVTALGPLATRRVETSGWHRNAYGVLWPTRVDKAASLRQDNWRTPPFSAAEADRPLEKYRGLASGRNVVLIALESTAAQYLGLYGATQDPMPHLTELAEHGVVFERAYTVYPESIKGLLSVLCSLYPAFQTSAETYASIPCPSLAQLLAEKKYRTALFHSGRFMYLGMEGIVKNRGFETLEDAGAIGGNVNSSFGVDEPAAVERILQWIDALPKDQPFFVTYLPVAGHHPYATPERGPFPATTEQENYLNALHYGDQSLGTLLRGLRERKLDQKTLFVLYGDHGEAFGQHDGNIGHSMFIYEENVRVPLVIAAPGLIPGRVRVPQTASVIDIEPTILDLLGQPIPSQLLGRSLLESANHMALFFTDYSLGFLGLSDGCWKFIFETDSGRSKLYDTCRDPGETADLSAREPSRVHAYRERLEQWIADQQVNVQSKD